MANTLTNVIPTLFAMGLKALRSNSVMPRLINVDYSTDAAEKGQTILIPLPSAMVVNDVAPGAYAPDPQNVAPTTASIPLNYWKEAPFAISEKELAQVVDGVVPMQLSAAVEAMATTINGTIMGLYTGVYGYTGTAGTTPLLSTGNGTKDVTAAREILNIQLAPMQNRRFVLNPDAEANALNLPAFQYYLNSGTTETIQEGQIGRKFGFDFFMDQQVPTQTAGTLTGTVTANGAQAAAPVGSRYSTVSIAAAAASGFAPNIGDIILFSGDSQTYAVVGGAAGAGTTATAVAASSNGQFTISPGKRVALTGGETVTMKASHVVNLAFHRDAFGFASRQLAKTDLMAEPDESFSQADPVSGLTMRLTYRREFHRTRLAFDVLWGVGLIRPELAVRLAG